MRDDNIIEPYPVDDSFVTALAQADHVEGCARLWFTVPETLGGQTVLVTKAKLIVPVSMLVPIGRAVLAAATRQEAAAIGSGYIQALAH